VQIVQQHNVPWDALNDYKMSPKHWKRRK
jgi:hypothetical protein